MAENFSPITGMSLLCRNNNIAQLINTTRAIINKVPPSSCTTMPRTVKWLTIAPSITPMPNIAPSHVVRGINNRIDAISSAIPEAYLPNGSKPTVSKMYMVSGAPVNLKKSVCSIMNAATTLSTQINIFMVSVFTLVVDLVYKKSQSNTSQLSNKLYFNPINQSL